MAFEKLDEETLDAWRANSTTEEFVDAVKAARAYLLSDLANTVKGGTIQASRIERFGGQLDVLDNFLSMLVK